MAKFLLSGKQKEGGKGEGAGGGVGAGLNNSHDQKRL